MVVLVVLPRPRHAIASIGGGGGVVAVAAAAKGGVGDAVVRAGGGGGVEGAVQAGAGGHRRRVWVVMHHLQDKESWMTDSFQFARWY